MTGKLDAVIKLYKIHNPSKDIENISPETHIIGFIIYTLKKFNPEPKTDIYKTKYQSLTPLEKQYLTGIKDQLNGLDIVEDESNKDEPIQERLRLVLEKYGILSPDRVKRTRAEPVIQTSRAILSEFDKMDMELQLILTDPKTTFLQRFRNYFTSSIPKYLQKTFTERLQTSKALVSRRKGSPELNSAQLTYITCSPDETKETLKNGAKYFKKIIDDIKRSNIFNIRQIIDNYHFTPDTVERFIYIFERILNKNNYKLITQLYKQLNFSQINTEKTLESVIYNNEKSKKYNPKVKEDLVKYYKILKAEDTIDTSIRCYGSLKFCDETHAIDIPNTNITSKDCPCCYLCGRPILKEKLADNKYKLLDYAIDHIIPVKYAYITRIIECPLNYIPVHKTCNMKKTEKLLSDIEQDEGDDLIENINNILQTKYISNDPKIIPHLNTIKECWNIDARVNFYNLRYLLLIRYYESKNINYKDYLQKCIALSNKIENYIII